MDACLLLLPCLATISGPDDCSVVAADPPSPRVRKIQRAKVPMLDSRWHLQPFPSGARVTAPQHEPPTSGDKDPRILNHCKATQGRCGWLSV